MMIIRKLLFNDLPDIQRLNAAYDKAKHTETQNVIFAKTKNEDNLSFGLFKNNFLSDYVCAYVTNGRTMVENFIWKDSKGYVSLLRVLFYRARQRKADVIDMYICDKGYIVLQRYINKYFNGAFFLISKEKTYRYDETLNHIQFTLSPIYSEYSPYNNFIASKVAAVKAASASQSDKAPSS